MTADMKGVELVIVGSLALDTIATPFERREDLLGGSVSYACAAASFFTRPGMVAIAGSDFPDAGRKLYEALGIDLQGLHEVEGKTFRWSGEYDDDMINRTTLATELNVFADFHPELPDAYRSARYVLLGNISPDLQLHVLDQIEAPEFVLADTMDLWINTARDDLLNVISRVDMLTLNDSEARLLTGVYNLRDCAAQIREWGPDFVVIKKGEHGAMLSSNSGLFLIPAYPVERVVDPTGAGDTFAGGFLGCLAQTHNLSDSKVREGLLYGAVVASFGVEAFTLERLESLSLDTIQERMDELQGMMRLEGCI